MELASRIYYICLCFDKHARFRIVFQKMAGIYRSTLSQNRYFKDFYQKVFCFTKSYYFCNAFRKAVVQRI